VASSRTVAPARVARRDRPGEVGAHSSASAGNEPHLSCGDGAGCASGLDASRASRLDGVTIGKLSGRRRAEHVASSCRSVCSAFRKHDSS
jgi:hypothetical protein